MSILSSIWGFFRGLFQNSSALTKVAVQELAYSFFKKHPAQKESVVDIIKQVQSSSAMPLPSLQNLLAGKVQALHMDPPIQIALSGMFSELMTTADTYIVREKFVTETEKYNAAMLVLGWVLQAAEM